MIEASSDYYGRRAEEQTVLGDHATTQSVAVIHYELAYRYSLLSSETETACFPEAISG